MSDPSHTLDFADESHPINYDREKELKKFDETKAGVKGLVDSGLTKIPRFFIDPTVEIQRCSGNSGINLPQVPIIDLDGFQNNDRRREIIDEVRKAMETWGFFQLVGHGIPMNVLEEMLEGGRRFHELPCEEKSKLYSRDPKRKVRWLCNSDLFISRVANWRDGLIFDVREADQNENHPICREVAKKYLKCMLPLKDIIAELISESLGLGNTYLKQIECMETALHLCNFYPSCPEPDKTLGASKHADPFVLTILLQDNIGGALQVWHQGCWVDVPPLPEALVVNAGDFMQLMTNDKYKSVEHRVLAQQVGPRVSIGCFFYPSIKSMSTLRGPLKEFISKENPPIYRPTSFVEYNAHFMETGFKGLNSTTAIAHFKL